MYLGQECRGRLPAPLKTISHGVGHCNTEDGMVEMGALLGTLSLETVELCRQGAPYLVTCCSVSSYISDLPLPEGERT